jgi:hypothetical protein
MIEYEEWPNSVPVKKTVFCQKKQRPWAKTRGRIFEGIFYWFLVIKTLKTILSKLLQFFRFSSRGEDMLLRRL